MRTSPSMWPASLEAAPSTPMPTGTPARRIARTGAMPEASRMLEHGQCATPVPVRANSSIPAGSSLTQCAHHTSAPTQPRDCTYSAGVQPNFSRVYAMSWSFSARCVCSDTINSRLTENGEHGATTMRSIA